MRKKFKVTLVVFLVVVLGCFSQAFAATKQSNKTKKISQVMRKVRMLDSTTTNDSGVVGTSNLNGTADNSAKVGDKLTSPEIGWKRYDDKNSYIQYIGKSWKDDTFPGTYSDNQKYTNNEGDYIQFSFYGTKLRVISSEWTTNPKNIKIIIDGSEYTYNEYKSGDEITQVVLFEKSGLNEKAHNVKIYCVDSENIGFDCIDIDSTGYLIDPSTPDPAPTTGNRATLTINMVNGSTKQYDLSEDELNSFLSWYNGMTNPLSAQCYTFNNPITGPYLNNKDYIPFNKIDDFKVQEYTK